MSLTYGFYNSVNHDRMYNAEDMSQLFEGVIVDGVFGSIGDTFAVTPNSGMTVNVGTGRAWFDKTWTNNSSIYPITVPRAEAAYNRIDSVVIEVNNSIEIRANSIKIVKGTQADTKPELVNNEHVHQHPIAYITVHYGATEITASDIENIVGTEASPFVTGIVKTASVGYLYSKWEEEFNKWFENLQNQLDDNQAAHLQHQIDAIDRKVDNAGGAIGDILYTKGFYDKEGIQTRVGTWALCNGDEVDLSKFAEEWAEKNINFDMDYTKHFDAIPITISGTVSYITDCAFAEDENGNLTGVFVVDFGSSVSSIYYLKNGIVSKFADISDTDYVSVILENGNFLIFVDYLASTDHPEVYIGKSDLSDNPIFAKYRIDGTDVGERNFKHGGHNSGYYFVAATSTRNGSYRYYYTTNPKKNNWEYTVSPYNMFGIKGTTPVWTGSEWVLPGSQNGHLTVYRASTLGSQWTVKRESGINAKNIMAWFINGKNLIVLSTSGGSTYKATWNLETGAVTEVPINADYNTLDSSAYFKEYEDTRYLMKSLHITSPTPDGLHISVFTGENLSLTNAFDPSTYGAKCMACQYDHKVGDTTQERFALVTPNTIYLFGRILPTINVPGVQAYIKLSDKNPEVN